MKPYKRSGAEFFQSRHAQPEISAEERARQKVESQSQRQKVFAAIMGCRQGNYLPFAELKSMSGKELKNYGVTAEEYKFWEGAYNKLNLIIE